jgi:hypothetical protein
MLKYLKPKNNIDLSNMSSDNILSKSILYDYIDGYKYLIDNNLTDDTLKYIIK